MDRPDDVRGVRSLVYNSCFETTYFKKSRRVGVGKWVTLSFFLFLFDFLLFFYWRLASFSLIPFFSHTQISYRSPNIYTYCCSRFSTSSPDPLSTLPQSCDPTHYLSHRSSSPTVRRQQDLFRKYDAAWYLSYVEDQKAKMFNTVGSFRSDPIE